MAEEAAAEVALVRILLQVENTLDYVKNLVSRLPSKHFAGGFLIRKFAYK